MPCIGNQLRKSGPVCFVSVRWCGLYWLAVLWSVYLGYNAFRWSVICELFRKLQASSMPILGQISPLHKIVSAAICRHSLTLSRRSPDCLAFQQHSHTFYSICILCLEPVFLMYHMCLSVRPSDYTTIVLCVFHVSPTMHHYWRKRCKYVSDVFSKAEAVFDRWEIIPWTWGQYITPKSW